MKMSDLVKHHRWAQQQRTRVQLPMQLSCEHAPAWLSSCSSCLVSICRQASPLWQPFSRLDIPERQDELHTDPTAILTLNLTLSDPLQQCHGALHTGRVVWQDPTLSSGDHCCIQSHNSNDILNSPPSLTEANGSVSIPNLLSSEPKRVDFFSQCSCLHQNEKKNNEWKHCLITDFTHEPRADIA